MADLSGVDLTGGGSKITPVPTGKTKGPLSNVDLSTPTAPKVTKPKVNKTNAATSATDTTDGVGGSGGDLGALTFLKDILKPLATLGAFQTGAAAESADVAKLTDAQFKKRFGYTRKEASSDILKSFDQLGNYIGAGAKNVDSLYSDKKVNTGSDFLTKAGYAKDFGVVDVPVLGKTSLPGLAVDVAFDPLTFVDLPVGVVAKAITIGGKTGLKVAKEAAVNSKVSVNLVKDVAEGAAPSTIKPGTNILTQYTKKPIIKVENVRATGPMAERLDKTVNTITDKLTYRGVQSAERATALQVIGSSIEANVKATAATFVGGVANRSLSKMARAEGKAGRVALQELPQIIENGVQKDIEDFVPHVTPEGTFVFDGKKLNSFADEAEATAWIKAQKNAPEISKVTRGDAPIVDTAVPGVAQNASTKLPSTPTEIKVAKANLKAIDKLAASATGISAAAEDVGTKIELKTNVKDALTKSFLEGGDPLAKLREFSGRGANTQDAQVAQHLASQSIVKVDGSPVSIATVIKSGKKFSELMPETQKQIADLVLKFVKNPVITTGKKEVAAVEKKYANIQEVVAGLNAGDTIDTSILTKILDKIDPDNIALAEIKKSKNSPIAAEQLKSLLVSSGIQTVEDTARRIKLMDSQAIMEAEGIALADIAAAYSAGRLNGTIAPADQALEQAREAASLRLSAAMNSTDADVVTDVLNNISRGLNTQLDRAIEIMDSEDVVKGVSSLDDLAIRNTETAFMADTKAQLIRQFNQSGEAPMLGSLFGLMRSRMVGDGQLDVDEIIKRANIMEDAMLAILGARNVYTKAAALAKGTKHYVFSSMHDVMHVFHTSGGTEQLKRALFPDTSILGVEKTDMLSYLAIGDAVRKVMEARELGVAIDMKDLVKGLLSRGDTQKAWSDKFKKDSVSAANEFAAHLVKPEVIARFEELHKMKSLAAIEDSIQSAETITEDLFRTLLEGRKANLGMGVDSTASRAQLARDWFNKFAYASGIFRQQSGQIAQDMLIASSQVFMTGGKLMELADEVDFAPLVGSPVSRDAISREVYADTMDAINSFFKAEGSSSYAGAGRERLPFPTTASVAKATDKLVEAERLYENHIATRPNLTTKAEISRWETKFNQLQARLDKSRKFAWQNSVPTRHWLDGKWISSERYNFDEAVIAARQNRQILEDGSAVNAAVDSKIDFPSYKPLDAAETKAYMDKWRTEATKRSVEAMQGVNEEAAKKAIDSLKVFDSLDMHPSEVAQRLIQEQIKNSLKDGDILVSNANELKVTQLIGDVEYKKGIKEFSEKMNAETGTWATRPLIANAQTELLNQSARIADVAHHLRKQYSKVFAQAGRNLAQEQGLVGKEAKAAIDAMRKQAFRDALAHAMSGTDVPEGTDKLIASLAFDLRKMLDPIFGNKETTAIAIKNIDPAALGSAFKRYGLLDIKGLINPSRSTPGQLADYLRELPFAKMPDNIKGTKAEQDWLKRQEEFFASENDPFDVLTRLTHAVQFAATEKNFVDSFASQFSAKAMGLSPEEAVKRGWVSIQGVVGPGGTDLTYMLPKAIDGGLFPPNIAAEFISLNKEWNKLYSSGKMPKVLRAAMEIQGLFKATQTIWRLGHHVANAQGDSITAMIAGTRNPAHWGYGLQVAKYFMTEDIKATWGKNKLDFKFDSLLQGWKNEGRVVEVTKAGVKGPGITIMRNGKQTTVPLNMEEIAREFEARGIVVGNIFQNDIQGLVDSIISDAAGGVNAKKLRQIVISKVRQGTESLERGPGKFAAWYGNVPRAAHAMQIIQSRSWNSIEEALNAATAQVNKYHPTIQSLSAADRMAPRMMFTYYTWLRVAHNAMIDMYANHGAALMFPLKVQYNQAVGAGYEPNSFVDAWDPRTPAASYLRSSPYAPTSRDEAGNAMMYKRSVLPLDVIDNWGFYWDPSKGADANIIANFKEAGTTLGSMSSLAVQPVIEWVSGTDLKTGQESTVKDLPTLVDKFASNIGFSGLLKGLGAYTPQANKPGSGKELTPLQEKITRENWLFGQKGINVSDPKYIKGAQLEQKQRFMDYYKSQQGK